MKKSGLDFEVPNGWKTETIGSLFSLKNGINAGKESYGVGVKFINVMEVINNSSLTYTKIPGSVQISEDQKHLYYVNFGDVLFNRTSEVTNEVGFSSVYLGVEDVAFGGFVIRGRPLKGNLDDYFKKYCFRSEYVRSQIIKSGQGAVRSNIGQKDLEQVKILLPPLPEQRGIAKVLGTMDQAIQTTERLIAQKELRKKWLMQNVLTGKKRLKGFEKEWREFQLLELFDRVTRKNEERNSNVVTISAQRGFVKQRDFFKKNIASEILDNYFLVYKGEFCYNKSYSNGYPWGATKRLNDFDKAVVTTLYICFGIKNEVNADPDFFEQFFNANLLDKGLVKIAHEGGRAHGLLNVTPSDFFSLNLFIPEMKEQTAIAQVLQTADQEINLLKSKADKLREQKRE
ncbi:restriction endonuclease subunit S [Algoriphagus sp.]|uniref:restriction endonuclease subunit S n=1 Tax=Algoriphagus sp. TaxID=1872435 RepID=UPI003F71ECA7